MNDELLKIIRETPILYSILREDSSHYRLLYQDSNYLKELKKIAKEKYKLTASDKLERLKKQITLIETFMSVID